MRHTLQNDAPADGFADCYLLGDGVLGAAVHGRRERPAALRAGQHPAVYADDAPDEDGLVDAGMGFVLFVAWVPDERVTVVAP